MSEHTAMKVYLLIERDPDDFDTVYGIYSSRENAIIAANNPSVFCADVVEVELDVTHEKGV